VRDWRRREMKKIESLKENYGIKKEIKRTKLLRF